MKSSEYQSRAEQVVLHTYNRFPVVLDHGKGVRLYDVDGNEYLDFGAGIAVCELGYGDPDYEEALKNQIGKLLHTSNLYYNVPAMEAGEKLGFLPGDMEEKVNPYLRPLYDALGDMLGAPNLAAKQESGIVEVAPLAFMRGRTLNDAFLILDEAQNTTREQMKMFLTRLGFGSRAVITGDVTQIDLPPIQRGQLREGEREGETRSGLVHALRVLDGVRGAAFHHFHNADVVRHPLVGRVVEAYDTYDKEQETVSSQQR